ncbi:MAG: hypothetical protein ACT4RN_01055 [Pseudonocardia sp.]
MTAAHVPTGHCTQCGVPDREHHDRLLTVDVDPDELLALLELAVTWHELDYGSARVVGPAAWGEFAAQHSWHVPERAERAFSLALDIVGRSRTAAPARFVEVLELVTR